MDLRERKTTSWRALGVAVVMTVLAFAAPALAAPGQSEGNDWEAELATAAAACEGLGGEMYAQELGNGTSQPRRCTVTRGSGSDSSSETISGDLEVSGDWIEVSTSKKPKAGEGVWKTTGSQTWTTTTTTWDYWDGDVYNWSRSHNAWVWLEDQSGYQMSNVQTTVTSGTTLYKCMANGNYTKEAPKCEPVG